MSMTPNEEILSVIRYAPGPIGVAAIYEQCKGIENISDVSSQLSQLFAQGKVAREEIVTASNRKGFAYTLPKPGAAAQRQPAATPPAAPRIAPAEIPTLGDAPSAGGKRGRKPKAGADAPRAAVQPETAAAPQPQHDAGVAAGLDLVEKCLEAERLADAIIARLKRELAPVPAELEAAAGPATVHIHIERIEIRVGAL